MPTTFANTINGNEILAKRAECDYAGNDIQTTYATKVEVAGKQDVISDLAAIRSGAAAGSTAVQPGDLASVATSGDYDDLNNKPSIPTATSDLTNDSGFITAADIPAQVNADWNSNSGASEILNKPDLSVYATTQAMNTALAGKQDTISDLSSIRSGASAGATAVQPGDLATVATTGSYDDLSDKPSIPAAQVNSDWNASSGVAAILNKPTLSAVATSGDYDDLTDKPDLSVYATDQELAAGLATKQDTISDLSAIRAGAQLGSTAVQPADLNTYATDAELAAGLATKQDTINDLSTIRSGAAAGSTALQPSDVATVATTGDYDDLSNKPSIPTKTSDLTNDSGFITSADVPVKGVEVDGASVVNAQGVAEITMPDLSGYATTQALSTGLASKQDTISDLSAIRSGAAEGATAVQPGDLATVATTGSYNDLSNKPDLSVYAESADLATVATTGAYSDLTGTPTIPTATSDLTNDSGFITSADLPPVDQSYNATSANAQSGTAVAGAVATKQDVISDLATIRSGAQAGSTAVQPGDLATVATTGAYSDLTGTPTIPTATSDLTNDSGFITLADVPAQVQPDWDATSGLGEILHKPDLSVYAETADLATVATTGSYTDLSNKPSIPTATSDLTNDSGFITLSDVPAQVNADWNSSSGASEILNKPDLSIYAQSSSLAAVATTGDYDDLVNKPSIPAAQVNSDWNAVSGVSEILNKPTLATVATTGAYSDLSGKPTVDQTYDAESSNAQSGTAVAQAISSVDEVPDVTSSDNGKVLVATYSGGTGSYAWASTPPANAIILDSSSTWSDFHTPYSAGRKDIYYKHTSPFSPFDSRAELYLHLTAVSDVDGSSTNFTYALFEGAWQSAGVDYTVRCQFRYSGNPIVHLDALTVEQSYSSSSRNAQSGLAVAQAISAVNQVPSSTSADADKVLTVDAQGTPAWATAMGSSYSAGNGIDITNNVVSVDTSVVATQTDLAGKEDAFDVGTGLEMDTSGATPTLQVEAPVDIVAGPGIVIDNPDGNTLRVSTDENYETVLWDGGNSGATSATLSESIMNFDTIEIRYAGGERAGVTLVAKVNPRSTISTDGLQLTDWFINNSGSFLVCSMGFYSVSADGLTLSGTQIKHMWFSVPNMTYSGTGTSGVKLFKIVGIHRIAGGN